MGYLLFRVREFVRLSRLLAKDDDKKYKFTLFLVSLQMNLHMILIELIVLEGRNLLQV